MECSCPNPAPVLGRRFLICRALVVLVLAALSLYLLWLAQGPVTTARGDVFGDAYVMMAAKHFEKDGFFRCRFLPVVQPGELTHPPFYYTHQPPGPYIVAGIERVLGVREVVSFRVLPVVLTVLSAAFFYALLESLFDPLLALLSVVALACAPALLYWADALDSYSYDEFFRAAAMFFWIEAVVSVGRRRRRLTALAWVAAFAEALFSFAYILYIQVFVWLTALILRSRVNVRTRLAFLLAPVLAFALHFAQNAVAVGGAEAYRDFRSAFLNRTLELETGVPSLNLYTYPLELAARIEHWHMNPIQALALWVLVLFAVARFIGIDPAKRLSRMLAALAVAGSVWWIVFPGHSAIHHVTTRQFLPFFALLTGSALYACVLCTFRKGGFPALRILAAALFVLTFVWQGHRLRAYTEAQENPPDLAAELLPIKGRLPADAIVLTNYGNHPTLAWLLDTPTFPLADLDALPSSLASRTVRVLEYAPQRLPDSLSPDRWAAIIGQASAYPVGDFVLFSPLGAGSRPSVPGSGSNAPPP
ncbi:MAG: hypothetical protein V2A58_12190 [Planctomycetota bacterium]